jgi:peptide/nickel transport system substrate-binding protein
VGVAAALALTACGSGGTDGPSSDASSGGPGLITGTTDKVTYLDPSASYDNGSYHIEVQVYQFLYGFAPGDPAPQPDAAEKCEYTSDTVLECKLKSGLKFANGHDLTASDVKFSFDRQLAIYYDNGPASLLTNLVSTEVKDDLTVEFTLKQGPDQTFLQILATPVGPIVDEEVFSPTELTPDADIVAANAFSGPYTIDSFSLNQTVHLTPYAGYNGVQGEVKNDGVTITYYSEATNLKLAIESGEIDMAYRSLTPTDIDSLKANDKLKVVEGPGGEIRYIVFNFDTMPGDTAEQKLAVRQAIASVVDRDELASEVYKGQFTPLCSWVPDGLPGANEAACDTYPLDLDRASKYLADAGVATPVELHLQYNPDHYGSSSDQEYARVKAQLEASGLFKVDLQSTEWVQYTKDRSTDVYPAYQLGWFPDFPDADNYLSPFFVPGNFLNNHFESDEITDLIAKEATTADPAERAKVLEEIQTLMAEEYLSTLPLLQGTQILITGETVKDCVLDASFQFRYATVTKG